MGKKSRRKGSLSLTGRPWPDEPVVSSYIERVEKIVGKDGIIAVIGGSSRGWLLPLHPFCRFLVVGKKTENHRKASRFLFHNYFFILYHDCAYIDHRPPTASKAGAGSICLFLRQPFQGRLDQHCPVSLLLLHRGIRKTSAYPRWIQAQAIVILLTLRQGSAQELGCACHSATCFSIKSSATKSVAGKRSSLSRATKLAGWRATYLSRG